jgi:hypothetical protein
MICKGLARYISRLEDTGLSDKDIMQTVETLYNY